MTHDERMAQFVAAGLYLVTSESLSRGRSTLDIVSAAVDAGVRLVQLREKELSGRQLVALASAVREIVHAAGGLLIINDRLDIALASGADGVHLGQDDLPVADARRLAPDLIIGASTHAKEQMDDAAAAGASYVNIGPLFTTQTKVVASAYLGLEGLEAMAPAAPVPFTVMGGIKRQHIPDLVRRGARTLAVVTAVTAADDPGGAARVLLDEIRRCGDDG